MADDKQGYSQETLVCSLSVLGELKQMLVIFHRESERLLLEDITHETKLMLQTSFQASGKMLKICSRAISLTNQQFSELVAAKKLFDEPP